jgi:predicted adenine nucleotide alpha hydrolase (AANH) superfamily ATPase
MRLLLHICCAPCSIFPVDTLRQQGIDVMGFFYRHNIHPFTECIKRQDTLDDYARQIDLKVIHQRGYELETFLQNVVYRETDRCRYCYHERLRSTALLARRGKFDGFTSTLLYSKFQKHDLVRSIGDAVGRTVGVPFFYADFREGWRTGVAASKRLGLYRQTYCGCIYSEKERYFHKQRGKRPRE